MLTSSGSVILVNIGRLSRCVKVHRCCLNMVQYLYGVIYIFPANMWY